MNMQIRNKPLLQVILYKISLKQFKEIRLEPKYEMKEKAWGKTSRNGNKKGYLALS